MVESVETRDSESQSEQPTAEGITLFPLKAVRQDPELQSRVSMSQTVVEEYRVAIEAGAILAPVVLFFDGKQYWLADGWHTCAATKAAEKDNVHAEIRHGKKHDALLYAAAANRAHGLRRTNEDKRKAVNMLLGDKEYSKLSDGKIAKHVGVTQPFVGKLRKALTHNGYGSSGAKEQIGENTIENKSDETIGDEELGSGPDGTNTEGSDGPQDANTGDRSDSNAALSLGDTTSESSASPSTDDGSWVPLIMQEDKEEIAGALEHFQKTHEFLEMLEGGWQSEAGPDVAHAAPELAEIIERHSELVRRFEDKIVPVRACSSCEGDEPDCSECGGTGWLSKAQLQNDRDES